MLDKPDLVASLSSVPLSVVVGNSYSTMGLRVDNDGVASAGSSVAKLYLVSSRGSLTEVVSYNIGSISAGGFSSIRRVLRFLVLVRVVIVLSWWLILRIVLMSLMSVIMIILVVLQ